MLRSLIKTSQLKTLVLLLALGWAAAVCALEEKGKSLEERRQDVYLTSLIQEKKLVECRKVLTKVIDSTDKKNILRLLELVDYAKRCNAPELTKKLCAEILKARPGDLKVKREMAFACLDSLDYELAAKYFDEYNRKTGGDFLTNYNQGELMFLYPSLCKSSGKHPSDFYFAKSLKQSYSLAKQSKDQQVTEAKSLFRLRRYEESFKVFDKLENKYPNDINILLDYTGFLVDGGYSSIAYGKLSKLPDNLLDNPQALKKYNVAPDKRRQTILNIYLTRTAYYTDQRDYFKLKSDFAELDKHYPESTQLELAKASYYQSFENWRGQLSSVKRAYKLSRSDQLLSLSRRLEHDYGSAVKYESGIRLSDNNGFEFINQVRGEFRLNDTFRIGAHYMVDLANLHDVPRMNGEEEDFDGVRNWLEVYAQADFRNGDMAKISYYNHSGISGVGGEYTLLDFWGSTRIKGAFCAPYWGRQQSIAQRGTLNYIELRRVYHPFECLSLTGTASLNSYNLNRTLDLARSVVFQAEVVYMIPEFKLQRYVVGENANFTLNYNFDGEFFTNYKSDYDAEGEHYNLCAYDDLNVHTFFVGFAKQFNEDLKAEAFAGYAMSVEGNTANHGAVYGISLSYMLTDNLEAGARVNHTISTNLYFYAGVDLKYSFSPNTVADILERYKNDVSRR